MKKRKLFLTLFILIAIFVSLFAFKQAVLAQDFYGLNDLNLALSNEVEPKSAIVNIINIVLGFLGLIAVIIIIYGGFVWMMSGGEAEKIDKAKKILKNGLIGLVIILLSWGIATFVFNFFAGGGGGGGGGGSVCTPPDQKPCFCDGTQYCQADGTWGDCEDYDCGLPPGDIDCNLADPFGGVCQINQDECDPLNLICSPITCKCVAPGSAGTSCNSNSDPFGACMPDDDLCGEYLSCNSDTCLCEGSPVITEISPMGGFCEEDFNQPCIDDSECICNTDTPNGAENNLITIYGANFGNIAGEVLFGDAIPAIEPSNVNSDCLEYWSDKQIIVAVPAGSGSMPIIVKTNDDKETSTNDGIGPNIPNFQFNEISRPGLCKIAPNSGSFNENLRYYGVNMFGSPPDSNVYFGLYDEDQRIRALNTSFEPDGKILNTRVANIATGLTSTFVKSTIAGFEVPLFSNYLNFYKNPEPDPLPYISSFEPQQGAPGQYVTIYGQGFGNQRGAKEVKIGTTTVDYIFPAVCADSVWSDDQIIVKVPALAPNGDHAISIEYPSETITTNNLNPDKFKVDSALALYPSLCKISPSKGQIGFAVSLWGEYFGTPTSTASFHSGVSVNGSVSQDGSADKLSVNVPESAITGPVLVRNGALKGNSLNFEIGPCQTDDECGLGNYCCPAGTYKANRCEASLDDCSLEVLNSVYEWSFATGLGTTTPPGPSIDSCLAWANQVGACPLDEFCPNSPGVCSAYPNQVQTVGDCGDDKCVDIDGCDIAGECSYNDGLNICIHDTAACSLANNYEYELDGQLFSADRSCQWYEADEEYRWHMTVNTSCPIDPDIWFMTANSVCVSIDICDACEGDLMCQDINNDGDIVGECVSQEICPPNSYCDTDNRCKKDVAGSCECCCEHGEDARDCCAPLQCKGECGIASSTTAGITTYYGNCYGCTVKNAFGTILQDDSNDACNCTGHINKYCDTSVGDGVCADCSVINNSSDCLGQSTCCWDDNTNECRGGDRIEDAPLTGYCAYYECTASGDTCDVDNPVASSTGAYSTIPQCNSACSNPDEFCNEFTDLGECASQNICCWDGKASPNVCRATIGGDEGKIIDNLDLNFGYCAYYNCDVVTPGTCDTSNKTVNGSFSTIPTCEFSCPGGGANNSGAPCYSIASSSCDQSICSNPFSCLQENGDPSIDPPPLDNCGRCCCDPDPANATTSCAFPDTEDLTCVADRDPCGGDGRGLCCGCSDDDSCGSPDVSGCGADTCCRARPELEEFIPSDDSDDVCRNAVIKVKFDQFMDPSSLYSNIRLLEESDDTCPSGTYFTQNFKTEETNLLAKIWTSLKNLFTRSATAYTAPEPTKNYCLVPGSVQINQATSTTANFYPNELLKASTTYYILVIGDESLNSETGVMSSWQIGMNGTKSPTFNTVLYDNSEIASFTTLGGDAPNSGVCALDYVRLMPDNYLFNRNDNDENENDNNVDDPSFDTIRDRDKLFTASAYSFDHQEIQGVTGYDWDWDLEISLGDDVIEEIITTAGLQQNQMFVKVKDNVRDDVAEIRAEIEMHAGNSFFGGDGAYNTSDIYVFICRNPWPSINPDGSWEPFSYDYNSKFYYCRDFGSSAYVDDLPAVIDEPVAPLKGECSVSGNECTTNSDCSGGETCIVQGKCSLSSDPCTSNSHCGDDELCINRIFREAYFFRQQGPSAGVIESAENDASAPLGGKVTLTWKGPLEYIYDSGTFIGHNRVYYGKKEGGSMNYFDLSLDEQNSSCSEDGTEYVCTYTISDLENNETYVFRVSAISQSNIETMFQNEVEAIPQDLVEPPQPTGCSIDYSPGDLNMSISCSFISVDDSDVHFLRFYHGLSAGQYGQSFDGQVESFSVTLPTNIFNNNTVHYFAVSAIDLAGNESAKSSEMDVEIKDVAEEEESV